MKNFELWVHCRRNGMTCDAGLQNTCQAENKEEARNKLYSDVLWLQKFYDEVQFQIKESDENIQ